MIDGIIAEVACNYVYQNGEVRFEFPEGYNTNFKLTIDPELIAATLSGSSGDDNYGHTATFDLTGAIFSGLKCNLKEKQTLVVLLI